MKRILTLFTVALVLVLLARGRTGTGAVSSAEDRATSKAVDLVRQAQERLAEKVEREELAEQAAEEQEPLSPAFFPKSRVLSRVSERADSEGRQRVIETVMTTMKEPYVRVERILAPGAGGKAEVEDEVAMVANQLLLQKPDALERNEFFSALGKAGALEVKEIGEEAFLVTFVARPEDPRALDGYISRVREIAGTDIAVEPNYIRKMF